MQTKIKPRNNNASIEGKLTIDEVLTRECSISIAEILSEAWENISGLKFFFFLGMITLIVIDKMTNWAYLSLPYPIDNLVSIVGAILHLILNAGFFVMALKKINGQEVDFGKDFFAPLSLFVPLLIAYILMSLIVTIGAFLLIIPGIYLFISYCLVIFIIIDNPDLTSWQALEISRKVVTKQWFSFFLLALILALSLIIGVLSLLIGLLWAIPLLILSLGIAYKKIFYE